MNTFDLSLDLSKSRNVNPIRLRQGDLNGTTIRALVFDHGALADLSGTTARWVMRLPGGEEYYRKAATVDATASTVTVEVDETQAASVSGRCRGYFQILDGSTVIASTGDVLVEVLPDALEGASVAESYDTAIQDAIDALDAAIEAIPDTVEDVLEAHPEWTTTVQDGAVTDAKLYQGAGGILARNQRLMYRLDNLLTNTLPEGDSATATDAAKTPLAGLSLYGLSTQDGTPTPSSPVAIESVTGNLYHLTQQVNGTNVSTGNMSNVSVVDEVLTFTATTTNPFYGAIQASGQGYANAVGPLVPVTAGETYTLCAFGNGINMNQLFITRYDASKVSLGYTSHGTPTLAYTVPDGTAYIAVRIGSTSATVGSTYDVSFSIFDGTVAAPTFVPYGCAGLWARGKNLLNIPGWWSTTTAASGITCTVNADGSVATSGTTSASSDVIEYGISAGVPIAPLEAGDYVLTGCPANGSTSTYALVMRGVRADGSTRFYIYELGSGTTVTLAEGEVIDRVYINVKSGVNMDGKVFYPMLRRAGTGAAFATYAETVTPIDLDGHELRSLPDGTRDELTVGADGRVTLVQRVGHRVFDGSSNEQWSPTNNGETWAITAANVGAAAQSGLNLRCDKLSPNMMTLANMPAWTTKITDAWYCKTDGITTMADWRAWLASNPLTLDYALATPVTHDLRYVAAVPLVGPDLTAQAVPVAPFALTYERDLNVTLARLEAALADVATS